MNAFRVLGSRHPGAAATPVPMLIALLTDIHANREALDACLLHAAGAGAEGYAFLGDVVGYGADPAYAVDTVARYAASGAIVLRGNHDEAVSGQCDGFNSEARAAIDWTRSRLDRAQSEFLAALPLVHEQGERLLVHANAWSPAGWDYVLAPVEAERSMSRTSCRLTFCGHTHAPALFHMAAGTPARRFTPVAGTGIALTPGRRWLAVIGAVGQPRDGNPAACYALLQTERGTLTYVRVPYDAEAAARKILHAGLPPRLAARLVRGE
jgi:diadenosine tetraphosphatase ApaH/serine/threonine PP2A family protein phosphatase